MPKSIRTALLLALAAVMLTTAAPNARAATSSFDILAGSTPPYGALQNAFKNSKCDTRIIDSALNGTDGKIIDARPFATKLTTVKWTAAFDFNGSKGVAYLFMFYTSTCQETTVPGTEAGLRTWRFTSPANARWMIVQANTAADLAVTVTAPV